MRKRYWNRKVSALLLAGLMFSALPVHAFAKEAQKSVDVVAQAKQEAGVEKDASTEGEDNAGGTQDGFVSAEEASELKGTEVDTENQDDTGKEAEGDGKTEQETGAETGKDADTDMNTDKDAGTDGEAGEGKEIETEASSSEKSEAENLTEKSSASGTGDAVLKTDAEIQMEENTTEASVKKAEAASEVKPEAEEELAEETLPEEELTLVSASDIPMTDTVTETESSLFGTWTVDGYTSLAFYGDGKGAMLLPTESYDFHYTLNDDQLALDFVSSRARDLSYTISLDADTLQLTSGTGTKTVTISLQRVE